MLRRFKLADTTQTGAKVPRGRRIFFFLPGLPLIVGVVGLAVAVVIGVVGLDHLRRVAEDRAASQAELLANTLAARILPMAPQQRLDAMQLASRRTGAEFLVVRADGDVVFDASLGATDRVKLRGVIVERRGSAETAVGRTRFATAGLGGSPVPSFLVAFVRWPEAEGASQFLTALTALTTLFLGIATVVAYAVAQDASRDVAFVDARVLGMAQVRSEPTGEPVPVRTLDEVGMLTVAFNDLVSRFVAADRRYREDLARVRLADRDRAAFLAAVSHELRTPLNAILGFADILLAEVDGPLTEGAREEIEQIRGSGQHLLELINDILEFSAIESGQLKLVRAAVDVVALANEVVRETQGSIGSKALTVRVTGEAKVHAFADAKRVRQILTNLVANAVKFTQRGEVVVAVARHGPYARISVRDTGPGINAAERAIIFEDYKQAGDERSKRRGTGLGLAITRRLVLMHGGSIHAESELGRGSTFHVALPLWFDPNEGRGGVA